MRERTVVCGNKLTYDVFDYFIASTRGGSNLILCTDIFFPMFLLSAILAIFSIPHEIRKKIGEETEKDLFLTGNCVYSCVRTRK